MGSGGFIGSHLAKFLQQGYSVATASRSASGSADHFVVDGQNPDFRLIVNKVKPDIVVNCMGSANVFNSFRAPEEDFRLNVTLLRQLLCALRDAGFSGRFLQLSSAAVYGSPATVPILESAPLEPISPYGWHKLQAEMICREFRRASNIRATSLRLFSVYGPGLRRQLLWDVYEKSRTSSKITLFGTGEETRDFIYVNDVARAIELLLSSPDSPNVDAINVANGRKLATKYVASYLLKCLGWAGDLSFSSEERIGDPAVWQADVGHLDRIGFKSAYTFETGVEELCQWLKDLS